ncbi:MAG TPA: hypothetical protein DCR94_05130 [Firmicutes bacterium]|nr:hypothetical protein [Bacillota bacterium]
MKKELIFTLASSILALGISSCGVANSNDTSNESDSSSSILDDTSTSSDTSSSNVSENKAVSTMVNLLEASNNLDASKINGATLSIFKNEWYSVEKDGVTTHKIINYEGQRNTLSFYKNEKAIVETEEVVSGTNGTDSITKYKNVYGKANGLFIDLVCDYADEQYTANSQKSNSKEIVETDPKDGEISAEEVNSIFNKGLIIKNKENTNGVISFLLNNYFSNGKFFASESAIKNATLRKEGDTYTLFSSEETKDDVENPLIQEYSLQFKFDEEGYLLNVDGSFATFAKTNNEKGLKSFEYVVSLSENKGERVDETEYNLDSYFFSRAADLNISFSEYNLGAATEIDTLNKKYYINISSKKSGIFPNIDKVKLTRITRNGNDALPADYEYEDDGTVKTIILKKGGNYSFFFKTTKIEEIEKTAEIIVNDLTKLEFAPLNNVSIYTRDNAYLPGSVLAGETQFSLAVEPTNAIDDVNIEILNNTIGATITKVDSSPFTYKLNTSSSGKITIRATSAALGEELSISKEVNVYANTDEGIASFLSETTWIRPNPTSSIVSLDLVSTGATSGTYTMGGKIESEFTASGTYSVSNGQISIETTEQSNSEYKLNAIKVEEGRGDIVVKIGRE